MFTKGQVVISKCGRDKAYPFIVILANEQFAYLVDGKKRKLDKPKKKKVKHLQVTNTVIQDIKDKLENEQYLLDADIRKALLPFQKKVKED